MNTRLKTIKYFFVIFLLLRVSADTFGAGSLENFQAPVQKETSSAEALKIAEETLEKTDGRAEYSLKNSSIDRVFWKERFTDVWVVVFQRKFLARDEVMDRRYVVILDLLGGKVLYCGERSENTWLQKFIFEPHLDDFAAMHHVPQEKSFKRIQK